MALMVTLVCLGISTWAVYAYLKYAEDNVNSNNNNLVPTLKYFDENRDANELM